MLIWVVTGYMSGEWLSLNAGMTGFILITFFISTCKSSKDHSKPRNEVDTSLKSPV